MGCGASSDQLAPGLGLLRQSTAYPEYEVHGQRADTPYLPQPAPPTTRKVDIFNIDDYEEIDSHAVRTPPEYMYTSFEELADCITRLCQSDLERVRALFTWMTSVDIASLQRRLERLPDPDTPLDYLLKIHWRMGNHAHFFSFLCQAAGIHCVVLTGVNKSAAYELGTKINPDVMAAQWNSVLVEGEWRLVDVFWASTCIVGRCSKDWALFGVDDVSPDSETEGEDEEDGETKHQVNEFFFLTDPDMLITTHLPEDPRWQLLDRPLTITEFEDYVYIRDRFFQMDVTMTECSHQNCVIEAPQGEVDIFFKLPESFSPDQQFRYLLYRQKTMDNITSYPLERYVFYQKTGDSLQYLIQLPLTGRFKMDIFGQDVTQHNSFDLLCSYLIDCSKAKDSCIPLPDNPDIGWGPGTDAERMGLFATSHKEGIIITEDGQVEIHFDKKNSVNVLQAMKHNQLDEWLLKRHATVRVTEDEVVINLRLPEAGDYAFCLFADEDGHEGELANVCNYLIRNQNEKVGVSKFPKLHNGVLGKDYLADQLCVQAISHPGGDIQPEENRFLVRFAHDDDTELLVQLHSDDYEVQALTDAVTRHELEGETEFELELPGPGEFGLNVYAKNMNTQKSRIYHVHTYLVDGTKIQAELPPCEKRATQGVEYISTTRDFYRIKKYGVFYNPLVGELFRKNAQDPPDDEQLKTFKKTDTKAIFDLKMPAFGEYYMNLYEKMSHGALVDVKGYHILHHEGIPGEPETEDDSDEELDPEEEERRRLARALEAKYRLLRQQLKAAIQTQDPALLKQAIREFEQNDVPDTFSELDKAKKLLLFISVTEDILRDSVELTMAMSKRHLRRLETAINAADGAGLAEKLGLQMKMARRILEQLRRIERLRHDILTLDQKTIAEIKSYSKPPEPVYKVMRATFVMLGDTEDMLSDWKMVQNQIGRTGKQSVKRRVQDFDVSSIKIDVVAESRRFLGKLDLDDVRDVSAGAAAFYVWVIGNIDEAEYRYTQKGGDLKKFRPRTKGGKGNRPVVSR